jgi:hypothetical protein
MKSEPTGIIEYKKEETIPEIQELPNWEGQQIEINQVRLSIIHSQLTLFLTHQSIDYSPKQAIYFEQILRSLLRSIFQKTQLTEQEEYVLEDWSTDQGLKEIYLTFFSTLENLFHSITEEHKVLFVKLLIDVSGTKNFLEKGDKVKYISHNRSEGRKFLAKLALTLPKEHFQTLANAQVHFEFNQKEEKLIQDFRKSLPTNMFEILSENNWLMKAMIDYNPYFATAMEMLLALPNDTEGLQA